MANFQKVLNRLGGLYGKCVSGPSKVYSYFYPGSYTVQVPNRLLVFRNISREIVNNVNFFSKWWKVCKSRQYHEFRFVHTGTEHFDFNEH